MRRQRAASVVMGFSVTTRQPARSAGTMYASCSASTVVTTTLSMRSRGASPRSASGAYVAGRRPAGGGEQPVVVRHPHRVGVAERDDLDMLAPGEPFGEQLCAASGADDGGTCVGGHRSPPLPQFLHALAEHQGQVIGSRSCCISSVRTHPLGPVFAGVFSSQIVPLARPATPPWEPCMALFDLPLAELRTYRPERAEPTDFDAFWKSTLDERAGHDLAPEFRPYDAALTEVEVYDASFAGWGGHRMSGWLVVPQARRGSGALRRALRRLPPWPRPPHDHLLWPASGRAVLVVDTRGQGANGGDHPGVTADPHGGAHPAEPWLHDPRHPRPGATTTTAGSSPTPSARWTPRRATPPWTPTGCTSRRQPGRRHRHGGGRAARRRGGGDGRRTVPHALPPRAGDHERDPYQEIVRFLRTSGARTSRSSAHCPISTASTSRRGRHARRCTRWR